MVENLFYISFLLLFFVAFSQRTLNRFLLCSGILVLTVGHYLFFKHITGYAYYISSAVFSFSIALMAEKLISHTRLCCNIQLFCVFSVFLDFYGWILWVFYYSAIAYNYLSLCVLIASIFLFLDKKGSQYVGGDGIVERLHFFYNTLCARSFFISEPKKEK